MCTLFFMHSKEFAALEYVYLFKYIDIFDIKEYYNHNT